MVKIKHKQQNFRDLKVQELAFKNTWLEVLSLPKTVSFAQRLAHDYNTHNNLNFAASSTCPMMRGTYVINNPQDNEYLPLKTGFCSSEHGTNANKKWGKIPTEGI